MKRMAVILGVAAAMGVAPSIAAGSNVTAQVTKAQIAKAQVHTAQVVKAQIAKAQITPQRAGMLRARRTAR